MTAMNTICTIAVSALTLALVVGCSGASSGTASVGDAGSGTGNGAEGESPAAGPASVADVRAALNLGTDPVDIDDSMEEIDDLIYEQAWTAESEDRVGDAVEPLLRAEQLFRVTEPEEEAHKQDARFRTWMAQAADHCGAGADAAYRKDRAALTAAFEKIDQACAACHKIYRKKKEH